MIVDGWESREATVLEEEVEVSGRAPLRRLSAVYFGWFEVSKREYGNGSSEEDRKVMG